jgi:Ca-activated chloride channel family protein
MMLTMLWPWAWLLLPLPQLAQWIHRHRQTAAAEHEPRATYNDALRISPVLARALTAQQEKQQSRHGRFTWLLWLAWIGLLGAISQPVMIGGSQSVPATGRALVLAIDLSGSMEKRDFEIDGKRSNRLDAVKQVASDFVATRRGDRVGLVLFGDEAFAASPLTFDVAALNNVIAEAGIGMAGRTTAIGDALGLAIIKLRDDTATQKAIILLSDGTNNSGATEPEDAARLAAEEGIRVHTIALSSEPDNTPGQIDPAADLDLATLEAIASTADGQFFRATSTSVLQQVYETIGSLESGQGKTPPLAERRDLRNWLLLVLLLSMLLISIRQVGTMFARSEVSR